MKLKILERDAIFNLLPEQGDFTTQKAIMDAKSKLLMSAEEREEFITTNDNGQEVWTEKANEDREVELNKVVVKLLKEKLEKLNEDKQLEAKHVSLYEKLVGEE